MKPQANPHDGTVTLTVTLVVDATDLIAERGEEYACTMVHAALRPHVLDLQDELFQEFTEVDGIPVAVRSAELEG